MRPSEWRMATSRRMSSQGRRRMPWATPSPAMIANLRQLVGQVQQNADGRAGASGQLSNAAEQAGRATQGIAASSQQVARGAGEQSRGSRRDHHRRGRSLQGHRRDSQGQPGAG